MTITKAIETHISLVDIPMRMNTVLVKQLYGIASLTSEEIRLKLLADGTEYDAASEDANQHLRLAMRIFTRCDWRIIWMIAAAT